ncbi:hypothetical protein C4D60_Mb06t34160 [Musa balbisiana]|uniref:Uncharacterized protein n=1 Tax=Musa balbisiana TaxID=52838 RepID=A0A4S8ISR0_MUSBA|nr:hypothetical protein C4D60_Mb06t34160 [Musa balbisiana]
MEIYMDEKWKLSKKEGRSSCSESRRVAVAEVGGPLLKGSASTKEGRRTTTPRSFSSRCASLVKEQRARRAFAQRISEHKGRAEDDDAEVLLEPVRQSREGAAC